jgi:hypothetical protein
MGFANIGFGAGSFMMGDTTGGITVLTGSATALGLIIVEAAFLDWGSPLVGVPGTFGLIIGGASLVYGFIRPHIYRRSIAAVTLLDGIHIAAAPDANGLTTMLAYTLSY